MADEKMITLSNLRPARGSTQARKRVGRGPGSGLGKTRWYVERTLAWFKRYGKIRIRTERRVENYEALVKLAACLICHRNL